MHEAKTWLIRTGSLLIIFALLAPGRQAAAGDLIEVRGADTKYRYADWLHTFRNAAVIDVFYDGVPGLNEFNFGGGYSFKLKKLVVIPLVYFVAGKEDHERAIRLGVIVAYEQEGWKLNSYLSHCAPLSGGVSHYQSLDTADFTRVLSKRWELGVQSGLFHYQGKWNPQVGPLVKMNDRAGYWGVSYRFGPQREFRISRVFTF